MAHKSIKSIRVLCRDGLAGPGLQELGPSPGEGLVSQQAAMANTHDSCAHQTSVCVCVFGGGGGEKLAYGQSQCVTFGLEFTLGSDAHADELVRIVELQRRHRVWRGGGGDLAA